MGGTGRRCPEGWGGRRSVGRRRSVVLGVVVCKGRSGRDTVDEILQVL